MTVTKLDDKGTYAVTSETQDGVQYEVDAMTGQCSCPAGRRGRGCKHAQAVLGFIDENPEKNAPVMNNGGQAEKPPSVTKLGYPFGVVTSAMQKEIRRGDVEAAVFWGLLLADKGEQYAWKRVLITAAEDIGLAAPEVVAQVGVLYQMWLGVKTGAFYWTKHHLTMAIVLLCKAPKSTEVEDLQTWTLEQIKAGRKREVPEYAMDAHTQIGKAQGKGFDTWYGDRVKFGMPINEYTRRIWAENPQWKPKDLTE